MAGIARLNPDLAVAWPLAAAFCMILLPGCRNSDRATPSATVAPAAAPSTAAPAPTSTDSPGTSSLTSGPAGRDFAHPWVVRVTGNLTCHGTLIHPRWVLTAAHCVTTGTRANNGVRRINRIEYSRLDPAGNAHADKRALVNGAGLQVFLHPDYRLGFEDHDIALVRLSSPFSIEPGLQTAALPGGPRSAALPGTVATYNLSGLQPGQVGLFRGSISAGTGLSFTVLRTNAADALSEGDSGSGIVAQENGRAVVRGVASLGGANRDPSFTDVFAHGDWIRTTMGTVPHLLAGFTRVSRRGVAADGIMKIDCPNTYGAMAGPMYADGAALGANCTPGQALRVECTATRPIKETIQATPFGITEFTMQTSCPPNAPTLRKLPHGQQQAIFRGRAAQSPDPVGICIREFVCRVGRVNPPVNR
jgi:hypothetical protein